MKVIYKYEITALDPVKTFQWPEGSKVVHVGSQEPATMQIWVEINDQLGPSEDPEERTFEVYGTGHHIHDSEVYVGTVLDDPFVWHLYERTE